MMIIPKNNKDISIIQKIWNDEFGDSYEFISTYINGYLGCDNYLLKMDNITHNPKAMAHFPKFENRIGWVGYLYAFMVTIGYRNKGVATQMIADIFQKMWARGDTLCATIPATIELMDWYCSRFGFVQAEDKALLTFNVADGFDFGSGDSNANFGFYRIINLLKYLKQWAIEYPDLKIEIVCEDKILPQNSGVYKIIEGDVYFEPNRKATGMTSSQIYNMFRLEDNRLNYISKT